MLRSWADDYVSDDKAVSTAAAEGMGRNYSEQRTVLDLYGSDLRFLHNLK